MYIDLVYREDNVLEKDGCRYVHMYMKGLLFIISRGHIGMGGGVKY